MGLPIVAIIVIVIACVIFFWMFVFAIVYFFFWDRKSTDPDAYLEPVRAKVIDNAYLNASVTVDTTVESSHTYRNDHVYENEDVSFNVMDVLEDTVKKSVFSFCIETNRLKLGTIIGKGKFGLVYKAELSDKSFNNPIEVAVKTVYGDNCTKADVESFLEEVMRMKGFQHHNVISTIGLVLRDNQPFVVLPFMKNGDLRTYMSDQTKAFTVRELLNFGVQVSDGMDYLSKQGFVHRDLAARNCMVTEDQTVKVADFGLSRDLFDNDYYRMEDLSQPLPIKWMAIECLKDSVFTRESDVWSFGVVMWEIMSRGKTPYTGIKPEDLIEYVDAGERLVKPASTPAEVYGIMTSCWKANPKDRPTFSKISTELHMLLDGSSRVKERKSISQRFKKTFRRK